MPHAFRKTFTQDAAKIYFYAFAAWPQSCCIISFFFVELHKYFPYADGHFYCKLHECLDGQTNVIK